MPCLGTPGIRPPEPTSVNPLFPGAGLYWGSSGHAPPPPGPLLFFFFLRGWGERRGPALCVVGGGRRIFRLLLDAGPGSLAWWGCTLIYLSDKGRIQTMF